MWTPVSPRAWATAQKQLTRWTPSKCSKCPAKCPTPDWGHIGGGVSADKPLCSGCLLDTHSLYVALASNIRIGQGLFTSRPILKGSLLPGAYHGCLVQWDLSSDPPGCVDTSYMFKIRPNLFVDAMSPTSSVYRYLNDPLNDPTRRANVCALSDDSKIVFKACTDIAPGDELLLDYGTSYWLGNMQ